MLKKGSIIESNSRFTFGCVAKIQNNGLHVDSRYISDMKKMKMFLKMQIEKKKEERFMEPGGDPKPQIDPSLERSSQSQEMHQSDQKKTISTNLLQVQSKLVQSKSDQVFLTDEEYNSLLQQENEVDSIESITDEEIKELEKAGYKLPPDFRNNPYLLWELPKQQQSKVKVKLIESELQEKFIRGSGNGGQGKFRQI